MNQPRPNPVLLFDGECGLCQRVVRLLLRLDRQERLHFATLQGPQGQAYLRIHGLPTSDFQTLVYVPDWKRRGQPEFLLRTAGVVAALRAAGRWGQPLAAVLNLFPRSWCDAAYRAVGRWRYRLFGTWRARPLARPEWAQRFLDAVETGMAVRMESR